MLEQIVTVIVAAVIAIGAWLARGARERRKGRVEGFENGIEHAAEVVMEAEGELRNQIQVTLNARPDHPDRDKLTDRVRQRFRSGR